MDEPKSTQLSLGALEDEEETAPKATARDKKRIAAKPDKSAAPKDAAEAEQGGGKPAAQSKGETRPPEDGEVKASPSGQAPSAARADSDKTDAAEAETAAVPPDPPAAGETVGEQTAASGADRTKPVEGEDEPTADEIQVTELVSGGEGCWKVLSTGERVSLTDAEWRQELSQLIGRPA